VVHRRRDPDETHGHHFGQADGVISNPGAQAKPPLVIGDRLIFLGKDTSHGVQLWSSDGTAAGTQRISSFSNSVAAPEIIESIKQKDGIGYFMLRNSLTGGRFGTSLWQIDGAPEGTKRFDLTIDGKKLLPIRNPFAVAGGWIYISAMIHQIPSCDPNEPFDFGDCNISLYRVRVGTHLVQLVKDINSKSIGPNWGKDDIIGSLTAVGSSVIFSAADRFAGLNFNNEPWRSGGPRPRRRRSRKSLEVLPAPIRPASYPSGRERITSHIFGPRGQGVGDLIAPSDLFLVAP
jgi:ELWxxDGT repeat protein